MEADFYIYTHSRPRDGSVFNCWFGRGLRAWEGNRRTALWRKTCLTSGGYDVRIVEGGLTLDQAQAALVRWQAKIIAEGLDNQGSV